LAGPTGITNNSETHTLLACFSDALPVGGAAFLCGKPLVSRPLPGSNPVYRHTKKRANHFVIISLFGGLDILPFEHLLAWLDQLVLAFEHEEKQN